VSETKELKTCYEAKKRSCSTCCTTSQVYNTFSFVVVDLEPPGTGMGERTPPMVTALGTHATSASPLMQSSVTVVTDLVELEARLKRRCRFRLHARADSVSPQATATLARASSLGGVGVSRSEDVPCPRDAAGGG
jgi:hypothetical protein